MVEENSMSFLEHLEELRRICLKSLIAVALGTVVCLFFSPQIYHFLKMPLQELLPPGSHFIATTPFESYATYLKISLLFGIFLSSPLIFYFFWSFVRPGLKTGEAKGIISVSLICSILFVGGALFGYFVVFPPGFQFAVKILTGTDILFFPKMSDYLSFALRLLFAFGLIFELPLFLLILGRFGIVHSAGLKKGRKYMVILIFLTAGILTPGPDVISQILMAAPLLILFEVGILLVKWVEKKPTSSPA